MTSCSPPQRHRRPLITDLRANQPRHVINAHAAHACILHVPDDMLCAYAERKATIANKDYGRSISTAQISYPVPVANTSTSSGRGGVRTLFNASGVASSTNTGNGGRYTSGGYDAYGGGSIYAIRDEHDEGDVTHHPYGGTVCAM